MRHLCRVLCASAGIAIMLLGGGRVGHCQGLDMYSFVHPFGLSSATTTRQFGMGGPVACVWDRGFGNPAFAATQEQANAGLRLSSTDFDNGTRISSAHAQYVLPLKPNERGLEINLFSLNTNTSTFPAPLSFPATLEMSENDLSVQYGQRFGSRLTGGIGISPYSRIKFDVNVQGGPPLLAVNVESDLGARAGLAYQWGQPADKDFIGCVYDYYQETAEGTSFLSPVTMRQVFHSDLLALGASRHMGRDLMFSAEYQRGSSHSGPVEGTLQGWHFGAEFRPASRWAVRAGANDGRPTLGIGYEDERCQVDYCYMNRWNDDIADGLFGGSKTHQVQAIFRW
jgi:hypothetical protein